VNNVSAPPEEEVMSNYPLKPASSRDHLDDNNSYVKPPTNYSPV